MKKTKKATSIIEAMVVMLIIVSGVTGMYNIYTESNHLSKATSNKIQAIQIARQGIEAFINIRDTNWLLFSSDYINCWNTLNYDNGCIGNTAKINIANGKSYIIYRNNNRWELLEKMTGNYSITAYRTDFLVGLNNGIYTQSGITEDLNPIFTREIKISYLQDDGINPGTITDPKMKITSLVQRVDSSSNVPHKVEINQILSNWKK